MKGGIGNASIRVRIPAGDGGPGHDLTVGAIVAVNAVGDVLDPATGRVVAGARGVDGHTLHGSLRALRGGDIPLSLLTAGGGPRRHGDDIGVVATDARLTRPQARKVAQMAHDGLARTIEPIHTLTDGDTLFALATGASGRAACDAGRRTGRRSRGRRGTRRGAECDRGARRRRAAAAGAA